MAEKMLVVKHYGANSIADKAGIQEGEAILSYGGVEVSTLSDIKHAIGLNRLSSKPIDVVICSVDSPEDTRTVQCEPGPLGAALIVFDADSGQELQDVVGTSSEVVSKDPNQSSIPGFVKVFAYVFGSLGVVSGFLIIANLGFVDATYSIEKEVDPFWISVGFAVALQSAFLAAFSLLCVMTWENTQQLKGLLSAHLSEGSSEVADELR